MGFFLPFSIYYEQGATNAVVSLSPALLVEGELCTQAGRVDSSASAAPHHAPLVWFGLPSLFLKMTGS